MESNYFNMIFPAKTKDGQLRVNDRLSFEAHLRDIGKADSWKDIALRVEHTPGKIRSLDQNDTLHGLLRKILIVLIDRGFDSLTVDGLRDWFSGMFATDLIISPMTGMEETITKGSSKLNTKEFNLYVANIGLYSLQEMLIERELLEPYISKCDFNQ